MMGTVNRSNIIYWKLFEKTVKYLLGNCYFKLANKIFRQVIWIPITTQKMKFSIKDFFNKFLQFAADLVTFTEEILNRKLLFLCSAWVLIQPHSLQIFFFLFHYERKWIRTVISPHSVWMREKTYQKNSEYGHFSRSLERRFSFFL